MGDHSVFTGLACAQISPDSPHQRRRHEFGLIKRCQYVLEQIMEIGMVNNAHFDIINNNKKTLVVFFMIYIFFISIFFLAEVLVGEII